MAARVRGMGARQRPGHGHDRLSGGSAGANGRVELLRRFRETFLAAETDGGGFVDLVAPSCTWTLMATGETFAGREAIRQLADHAVAARGHTEDLAIEPATFLATSDYFVVEYLHPAIPPPDGPTSGQPPAGAEVLRVPTCLVAHIREGKFDWIHEYFDVETTTRRGSGPTPLGAPPSTPTNA